MVEHRPSFLRLRDLLPGVGVGCVKGEEPLSVFRGSEPSRPAARSPEGHSVLLAKLALSYMVSQFVLILFSRNSRDYSSELISTILIIF